MAYQSKYLQNVPHLRPHKKVSVDEVLAQVESGELFDCFANAESITLREFVSKLDSGEIPYFCFDGPGEDMEKLVRDVRSGKYDR